MALMGEGVVKELCADASMQTSSNVLCLHLKGARAPFPPPFLPPPACA